jgi:hypothetical protein
MTAKLDALRELIVPTTEEEARASMRAYEAESTPGFVPAENEIYEREMKFSAVKVFFKPISDEELRELAAKHIRPGEDAISLEDVGLSEAAKRVLERRGDK